MSVRNTKVTVFPSVTNSTSPTHTELVQVLARIKRGAAKDAIEQIRNGERQKGDGLLCVCYSGTFAKRNDDSLIRHSGVVALDFDHVEDVPALKKQLSEDEYIVAAWTSTSGNGVHALMQVENPAKHKEHYEEIINRYDVDPKCKNVSRFLWESYDPDIYVNFDAVPFPHMPKAEKIEADWRKVTKPLEMIRNAVPGTRHDTILRASKLMGGYVSGGSVEYDKARDLLRQEVRLLGMDDEQVQFLAVDDGMREGVGLPIREIKKIETTTEQRLGKIYYTVSDIAEEVDELYFNGIRKGYHIGFDNARDYYTVLMGTTTYIYGSPYSGKSLFWFEVLVGLSENYGLRHAIFSPETGDAKHVFAKLMAMSARRDFYDNYKNQMTEAEYRKAKAFVEKHFIVLDPSDKVFTPTDFLDCLDFIERDYNVKIHTATIDPWNELSHELDGDRQDLYLEKVLGKLRQNAQRNERHNCLITHVRDQQVKEEGGIRYFPRALPREIAGGQAWYRKGMNMISVWRPAKGLFDNENQRPFEENEVVVYLDKIKPEGIGKQGEIRLHYDVSRHRYYEKSGGDRIYSHLIPDEKLVQRTLTFEQEIVKPVPLIVHESREIDPDIF